MSQAQELYAVREMPGDADVGWQVGWQKYSLQHKGEQGVGKNLS